MSTRHRHHTTLAAACAVGACLALATALPAAAQTSSPASTPAAAEGDPAPAVLFACYVPSSGTVYRIKEPGLPDECSGPPRGNNQHVEFSWTEGVPGHLHANLNGLAADDHPQYLLADGSRALAGDLAAGGNKVTDLAAAAAPGEAVAFEQIADVLRTGQAAGGDLDGTLPDPTVAGLRGRALADTEPGDGQVLAWDEEGDVWTPSTPAQGVTEHGALQGLGADDHPQYLLADGDRALGGDLSAGGHRITGLAPATDPDDAVRLDQLGDVVGSGSPAGGDLAGSYPDPTVTGLRGRPVDAAAPSVGDVLTWNGSAWEAGLMQNAYSGVSGDEFVAPGLLTTVVSVPVPDGLYLVIGEIEVSEGAANCRIVEGTASAIQLASGEKGRIISFFHVEDGSIEIECGTAFSAPFARIAIAQVNAVRLVGVGGL